jgi:chemosensory pili system protein ChpA (sensor histidine kinase/response regulator)
VQALTDKPGDMEQQTALRRAFHTLKGSSRMVGLTEFGEAAWSLEQVLNAWLPEQKPITPRILALARQALTAFGDWVADIARQADAHWRAAPFAVSADALRKSGQVVPLAVGKEALTAAPAPVAEAEPVVAEPVAEPAAGTQAGAIEAAPSPPAIAASELAAGEYAAAPPLDIAALDLPDLTLESADAAPAAAPDFAASVEVLEADIGAGEENQLFSAFKGLRQQDDAGAVAPAQGEGILAREIEADAQGEEPLLAFDMAPQQPPSEPTIPLLEGKVSAPVEFAQSVAPRPADEEPAAPAPGDDASLYKQIGDLKISIPLYNVYLGEADGWSRELNADLSEWALMLGEPVPERAMACAHSLAGASATVGFTGLSELARAVEHALQRLHVQPRGTAAQATTLVQAAQDIGRLLHQFAAGILKESNPQVLQAVHLLEPAGTGSAAADTGQKARAPVAAPVAGQHLLADEIGVADAVDEDLFHVFEEEAEELLPRIAGALRAWVDAPEDRGSRDQLMRGLHTLKGSARLAGALRLGEMAHRTESAIGLLSGESLQREDIEPMLDYIDEMRAMFRQLQMRNAPDAQEMDIGAAIIQPVQPPVPPVQERPPAPSALAEPSSPALAAPFAPPPGAPAPVVAGAPVAQPVGLSLVASRAHAQQAVRVRTQLLDRLVNQVGEVITSRARLETEVGQLRTSLTDLTGNLNRLRTQLRDVELQAETQMQSRLAQTKDADRSFDPLEFDRFTRMQELTRIMAESVNDVATVQRTLQRAVESSESNLAAQARQARELQRDLLRTRMVEFDSIAERLYRVVRQSSKEAGKQVRLDIVGGAIEMDRGILERMAPAFEHLLRNCVVHGIEPQAVRAARGKDAVGLVSIEIAQSGNEVSVQFGDDGGGLDAERIRERAIQKGLVTPGQPLSEQDIADLIFAPGLTTVSEVTALAGRGVGMDVVHTEIQALGGRVETSYRAGQSTTFKLLMPLTTAVTHVVMLRAGELAVGVPSNLVEVVRRVTLDELKLAYRAERFVQNGKSIPFYWSGALLQSSPQSTEPPARTATVVVFRSADRRAALHVDEVLGQQEVVVKSLGPQLARLPGLAAITALASGAVALIYNPVALANVYGHQARAFVARLQQAPAPAAQESGRPAVPAIHAPRSDIPLVLVVDDSITVRRVTQRLLQREGYRVALANDGLQGLERLQAERPSVVLTDIEMPRMDGFDFVRAIRADQALRTLPVIMITSRIAEKHRDHARQLGVNDYLGKPYPEEELLGLIKRYVREAALKQS